MEGLSASSLQGSCLTRKCTSHWLGAAAQAPPASPMHFPLPPRLASPLSVGARGSDSPEAFVFDHYGLFEGGARSPLPSSPALNHNLNPALSLGRAAQTGELAEVRARMLSVPFTIRPAAHILSPDRKKGFTLLLCSFKGQASCFRLFMA